MFLGLTQRPQTFTDRRGMKASGATAGGLSPLRSTKPLASPASLHSRGPSGWPARAQRRGTLFMAIYVNNNLTQARKPLGRWPKAVAISREKQ